MCKDLVINELSYFSYIFIRGRLAMRLREVEAPRIGHLFVKKSIYLHTKTGLLSAQRKCQ